MNSPNFQSRPPAQPAPSAFAATAPPHAPLSSWNTGGNARPQRNRPSRGQRPQEPRPARGQPPYNSARSSGHGTAPGSNGGPGGPGGTARGGNRRPGSYAQERGGNHGTARGMHGGGGNSCLDSYCKGFLELTENSVKQYFDLAGYFALADGLVWYGTLIALVVILVLVEIVSSMTVYLAVFAIVLNALYVIVLLVMIPVIFIVEIAFLTVYSVAVIVWTLTTLRLRNFKEWPLYPFEISVRGANTWYTYSILAFFAVISCYFLNITLVAIFFSLPAHMLAEIVLALLLFVGGMISTLHATRNPPVADSPPQQICCVVCLCCDGLLTCVDFSYESCKLIGYILAIIFGGAGLLIAAVALLVSFPFAVIPLLLLVVWICAGFLVCCCCCCCCVVFVAVVHILPWNSMSNAADPMFELFR